MSKGLTERDWGLKWKTGSKEERSLREWEFPHARKKLIQCDSWELLSGMTMSTHCGHTMHFMVQLLLGRRSCVFIIASINRTTLSSVTPFSFVNFWCENYITCILSPLNWCNIRHIPVSEEITVRKFENSVFVLYDTKH